MSESSASTVGTTSVLADARARPQDPPRRNIAPPMRWLRWIAAASIALNVAGLSLYGWRHLRQPAWVRPSDERARAAMFHGMTGTRREVVVVGDSLTQRGEWWELLERPVANRGISSDTIADVRARLDDIVALEPRVLFLCIGVNDLFSKTSPATL